MGKGILANDRCVWRHVYACIIFHHFRCLEQVFRLDVGLCAINRFQAHNYLCKISVSSSFSYSIYSHLDLACSSFCCHKAVSHSYTEIIVTMNIYGDFYVLMDRIYQLVHAGRGHYSYSIRYIDNVTTCSLYCFVYLCKVVKISTGSIHG